jgi:hypothetical protein
MSTVSSFLFAARYVLGAIRELARYLFRFGWALLLPRAVLAARAGSRESTGYRVEQIWLQEVLVGVLN